MLMYDDNLWKEISEIRHKFLAIKTGIQKVAIDNTILSVALKEFENNLKVIMDEIDLQESIKVG